MSTTPRVLVVSLILGLGLLSGQSPASALEPIGPAQATHFDAPSLSAWPAVAFTPEGRRLDAYLAEHPGGFALFARMDYLRPWHLYQPWPDYVTVAAHPDIDAPAAAMDANGNALLVWALNSPSGNLGVFARGLDSFGQPRGEAFLVDANGADRVRNTVVATGNYGLRFLVAWKSQQGSATSVRAQLFDQDLQPVGSGLVIDDAASDAYAPFAAAWAPTGWWGPGYVAWTGLQSSGQGFPGSLWIRTVSAQGQMGPATLLLEQEHLGSSATIHEWPALGIDGAGNLVLTWRQYDIADQGWTRSTRIMAQRFDAGLMPLAPAFEVSDVANFSTGHQPPSIAVMPTGEFVVAWGQSSFEYGPQSLYARQFDAEGTALGLPFLVDGNGEDSQYTARVAMDADGDTAFAWTRVSADGARVDAMLRRYRGAAEIDLAVESWETGFHSAPGEWLQFALQVRNLADSPDPGGIEGAGFASGLTLAIDLPAGSQLVDASGSGWTCEAGGTVVCASRVVVEGGDDSAPLTLQLHAPEALGSYAFEVSLMADQRDPVLANNSLSLPLTVAVAQPDAFAFASRAGVARSSLQVSEAVALSGFAHALPISVANGEYSINGSAFTVAAGSVVQGDSVRVRHVAAASFDTTVVSLLSVGEFQAEFATTTESADAAPDTFDFVDVVSAPRKADVFSNTVTITGINTDTPISISGGGASYSRNGGAYTTAPGIVRNGDTIRLRMRSANSPNSTVSTTVSIGGVTDVWRVTTGR